MTHPNRAYLLTEELCYEATDAADGSHHISDRKLWDLRRTESSVAQLRSYLMELEI